MVRDNVIEVDLPGAPVEQDTTYRGPAASFLRVSRHA